MSFSNQFLNRLILILFIDHFFSLSLIVSSASIRSISLTNEAFLSTNDNVDDQGFLGCKYDESLCKQDEFCFDDHLFGQCEKRDGIRANIFRLKPNSERLSTRKFQALKHTFHVLKHLNLSWKDRSTQCILSEILFSPKRQWFDRLHLKLIYKYCFDQRKFDRQRRASAIIDQNHQFHYHLPYASYTRSAKFLTDLLVAVANPDEDYFDETMMMNHPDLVESSPLKTNQSNFDKEYSNDKRMKTTLIEPDRTSRGYIVISRDFENIDEANRLLSFIAEIKSWSPSIFIMTNVDHQILTYDVIKDQNQIDVNDVINTILDHQKAIEQQLDIAIVDIGIGQPNSVIQLPFERHDGSRLTIISWIICTLVFFFASLIISFYCVARNERIRFKLMDENFHRQDSSLSSATYLCQSPVDEVTMEKTSYNASMFARDKIDNVDEHDQYSSSKTDRSPVNFDISTGHLILSYIQDQRECFETEWNKLSVDEHTASFSIALSELNMKKNRSPDCIPYDHARIQLVDADDDNNDYINASPIADSSLKCKYIATQGPMPNTTNAFWQMVWEQGSCVIVVLARPIENGQTMYHHYWPIDGTKSFGDFEVNLVSEHSWSVDYLVRSFYLKNIQTMETRTITQYHFLTWPEFGGVPSSKALLDFRRKVNKSCHGRCSSSPIIVHCNDGCGRTGTFILIDMILNNICQGTRALNIVSTLEQIRNQRTKMIKTKEQFEFVFVVITEELKTLLKMIVE